MSGRRWRDNTRRGTSIAYEMKESCIDAWRLLSWSVVTSSTVRLLATVVDQHASRRTHAVNMYSVPRTKYPGQLMPCFKKLDSGKPHAS